MRRRHLPGDRRDYFQAPDDIWQIVRTLAEERRKREIDPTLSMLRDVLIKAPPSPSEKHAHDRMREMHELIELLVGSPDHVQTLDNHSLKQLLTLGAGVSKLLQLKGKVTGLIADKRRPSDREDRSVFDAFHLARAQFAFTVGFHIVFPGLLDRAGQLPDGAGGAVAAHRAAVYLDLFRYWLKMFSLGFGMGVVSGVVMSYQFGTNWGAFADKAGPVVGPLMGYEVLTAFFLEAGFLGVMLFGMSASAAACISSPPAWWRSARCSRRSGSWR